MLEPLFGRQATEIMFRKHFSARGSHSCHQIDCIGAVADLPQISGYIMFRMQSILMRLYKRLPSDSHDPL